MGKATDTNVFEDLTKGIVLGHSKEYKKLAKLCGEQYEYDDLFVIAGEGVILKVKNKWMDYRKSVLKIPRPEIYQEKHKLDRFFAGCGVQSRLHRELPFNIPEVYRAERTKPFFYEMEYFSGMTLLNFAKKVNDETLFEVFIKLLVLVNDIHEFGFIHRDLKPSNVIVTKEKNEIIPVLIDFGLSKKPEIRKLTAVNKGMGSIIYASPRSCENSATCSYEDDVWSLARIMFVIFARWEPELSSGKRFVTHNDFPENKLLDILDNKIFEVYDEWRESKKGFQSVRVLLNKLGYTDLPAKRIDNDTRDITQVATVPIEQEEVQQQERRTLLLPGENFYRKQILDNQITDSFVKSVWRAIEIGVNRRQPLD